MDNPHYVTPEEAERKRCVNPNGPQGTWEYYCKHKECLAWRWQHLPAIEDGVLHFEPRYSTTHGYCGMVRT